MVVRELYVVAAIITGQVQCSACPKPNLKGCYEMNVVVLVKMNDELVEEVETFGGPTALPDVMKAFQDWTGVSYYDFARRYHTTDEDSLDILGEEFAGTKLYFNKVKSIPDENQENSLESMMTLSTAHITQEVADELLEDAYSCQLIYYPKSEYGYFLCVLEDELENENSLPECLKDILACARSKGVQWVMLDRDADTIPELPVFDW